MDIKELIEKIVEIGGYTSIFTIEMKDTQHPPHIEGNDYFGVFSTTERFFNQDDAIGFLFDCDVHLWNLLSFDISCVKGWSDMVHWNIVLMR